MSTAKVQANKIHLRRIIPVKEYLDNQFYLQDKEFEMGIAQSTKHNLEKKSFKLSIAVTFHCDAVLIADYVYDFVFEVENFEEFQIKQEDKWVFPSQLIGTLIGISYSTIRGILYGKFSDSKLNGFILPVVDPNEILKSKIVE